MKLNKLVIVSIILLAIISFGAASAASDDTAADDTVGVTEELDISTSDVDEIATDGGDDDAVGSDANDDSRLGVSAGEDTLSAGSVAPNYKIDVTPNATDAGNNYVAQYGQIINVKGDYGNATGTVSVRFGFSNNYYYYNDIPLVDGKFSQDLTDYDRVRNNYQIQVKYSGDDYYKSATWSKNIHVQMQNVTANDAYYGLNPYMDVNLFDATGNVTFTLNGRTYTKKLEDGKTTQEFTNYTLGKNTVTMYYEGDGVIKPIEKSFTFTVDANVRAPTIYNFQPAIVEVSLGEATGKVSISFKNKTEELDIVGGIVTTELKDYDVGDNTFEIAYSGDNTFNPFKTTATLTVLGKENATIISSVYQTASQNFIFINIPYANGTINVTVNGKKEVWELVNGTVKKDINATDKINELTVSYAGNVRLNPSFSSFYVNLTDYVVNNKTFRNYFDISNGGRLYDFIEDGVTLDFQGRVFVNTNSENEIDIIISKPINIISSTNDAYINLNTTAGSLLGEHPGSSFVVGPEGSGSNISGIYLHNTELWISNTTNVVFDNISVVVEDQRVGSGVGATSVRDNSTYVTLKNSYFYTRNNGGSTTFTFAWAHHCVFDNNTVRAEGNVGNLLYLNVYNIKNAPTGIPLNTYNTFSNNRVYGKEGSAISVGIMVEGAYNIIANNTCYKCSIGTSFGGVGANNNTYYGNTMTDGSSLSAQSYSIVYGNNATGSLTTGTYSIAYDNVVGKTMTVSTDVIAYNNTVGTKMTVNARSTVYNNTVGELTVSGANAVAYDNAVAGAITVSGANAVAYDNGVAGAMTVSGANAAAYDNNVSGAVTVSGAGAKVYNQDVTSIAVNGKGAEVFNVTAQTLTVGGAEAIVHDSVVNGTSTISSSSVQLTNNTFNDDLTLNSGASNTLISENNISGTVNVNSNNNQLVNNDINSSSVYAIDLGSSANNKIKGNKIYSRDLDGVGAVKSGLDTNIFESNYPYDPNLTIEANDISVNDPLVVKVSINENATGTVTLLYEGVYYDVNMVGGKGQVPFNNLAAGQHIFTAIFKGTGDYGDAMQTKIITCNKHDSSLSISTSDLKIGEDATVTVTIPTATGKVNIVIDGVSNFVDLVGGVATATINQVTAGTHTIVVNYAGDDANNMVSGSKSFTLEKSNPSVNIVVEDLEIGADAKVTVTVVNATGKVNIIIDGVENIVDLADGVATATIQKVTAGTHTIVANYAGDGANNPASDSELFALGKVTPIVDVTIGDLKRGEDASVTVAIVNATGKVNIIIDGVSNLVDLVGGVATATIQKVTAGTHTVVANYAGDAKNNAAFGTASKTLTVLATEITDVNVDGDLNINAVLKDSNGKGIENATIIYKVGTQNVSNITTGVNGTFTIKGEENAKVIISFAGNDLLFSTSTEISLSDVAPTRIASVITVSPFTSYAIDTAAGEKGALFTVTLKDEAGNAISNEKLTVVLDNQVYDLTTGNDGVASMQVNIANAGTYVATVSFLGNVYKNATFTTAKVVINKKTINIVAKAKKFKAKAKTKKYTATLQTIKGSSADGKTYLSAGKQVTLTIKGKVYTAKTNKNGKVTFKIKKLTKKGKYKATIKFAGDSTYSAASKKVKITLK